MRNIINFNRRWAFTKMVDEIPTEMPTRWDIVNLPHSWNGIDGQDGGNDYYRGKGYYAKAFDAADLPVADRYYLEIRGANSSADVYLNGRHLAHHDGGYSLWRVELTEAIQAHNLLVIVVDNSANDTVYPQMADFTFYGGLYRDVSVIGVSESHFDLDYYGGTGLKVTPRVLDGDAEIEVEVFVCNGKAEQRLRFEIIDAAGEVIARLEGNETKVTIPIWEVHLWHGKKDPYLYTAQVQLIQHGETIDEVSTRFGCRTFRIDPDRGFILNSEEYPLRGVSRHQDTWGKGNALSREDHKRDMDLIREMGATTIRLAHYQQDPFVYDLCDEYGFVVWAEIPYISKHLPKGRENTLFQMRELVIQNYHHPSIVVWGLSNEIGIGGMDEEVRENHRVLNDLCHEMDPTRLTTIAAVSMCPMDEPYLHIPDVVSYNHYFGWYGGDVEMNGPWFDKFHAMHPHIPIGCSEYGCEALDWHTSQPVQGDYTEEYQAYYHEQLIKQFFSRSYLWATHVWNMFDFGADARNEGGENGQNHKGLVTIDRRYKKDAFYAYKAWLSDEPFVHICGKRYVDRVEDVTRVTVYSNLPTVELFVNGRSVGQKTAEDHFFHFDVPNSEETNLIAVAGNYKDQSVIRKVERFNESYRLKEKGAILNWFDVNSPDGYLSLNDKMSEVLQNKQGQVLLAERMQGLLQGDTKVAGFEMTPEMMDMMSGFTVLRLLTLMAGMSDIRMTKEELLTLNAKLNQIKK